VQTDNSFLGDKVALRLSMLPQKKSLHVCDAYHGAGTIWKNIQKEYNGKIEIIKIDKELKDENEFILLGDNIKFLSSLDLCKFDVIDLDAYGIPSTQLKIIFNSKFHGIIFITFIQSMFGSLPVDFLEALGYSKKMIEKCKTLFIKNGFDKLKSFLASFGITKITYRKHSRKIYLAFDI